ncbi:MAG: molybdopterin molybdenumtransferase MoeA, partial [Verrucomicrobiota bacterium]
VHASRINSRPGRPLIFATRGRQVAFGLPGNPLSHWVCFHAFVTRALARLEGRDIPALINARLAGQLPGAGDGRRTWTPARRQYREGMLYVEPLCWQHSGDLTPLASADALLMDRQDPATHLIPTFLL